MGPTFRNRFPVSNRGKGPRKPTSCRTTLVAPTSVATAANVSDSKQEIKSESPKQRKSVTLNEAQRIGNAVNGIAVAVSRKTKRKLPLLTKEIVVGASSEKSETIFSKETNVIDHSKKTIEESS